LVGVPVVAFVHADLFRGFYNEYFCRFIEGPRQKWYEPVVVVTVVLCCPILWPWGNWFQSQMFRVLCDRDRAFWVLRWLNSLIWGIGTVGGVRLVFGFS